MRRLGSAGERNSLVRQDGSQCELEEIHPGSKDRD